MERLSRDDQDFIGQLPDGGGFTAVKEKLAKEARLAGRVARWHMDVVAAEREAAKLELPMLMAFMVNGDDESRNLESKLGFSREFRDWAGKNLVLCMLKVDDPDENRTTSFSADEDRDTAARYGIVDYSGPSVMLVDPNEGSRVLLSSRALTNPDSAISAVVSAMSSTAGWRNIVALEAPEKKRASVNSASVFTDSGGGGG